MKKILNDVRLYLMLWAHHHSPQQKPNSLKFKFEKFIKRPWMHFSFRPKLELFSRDYPKLWLGNLETSLVVWAVCSLSLSLFFWLFSWVKPNYLHGSGWEKGRFKVCMCLESKPYQIGICLFLPKKKITTKNLDLKLKTVYIWLASVSLHTATWVQKEPKYRDAWLSTWFLDNMFHFFFLKDRKWYSNECGDPSFKSLQCDRNKTERFELM